MFRNTPINYSILVLGIVLTHQGKALSEVQRFERGEEDEHPELDSDVVALANFGGGGLNVRFADDEGKMRKFSRYSFSFI